MFIQLQLLPNAIAEMYASVADTGVLTLSDRYGLVAALMDDTLSQEERRAVNRILRAVIKGRIQVTAA